MSEKTLLNHMVYSTTTCENALNSDMATHTVTHLQLNMASLTDRFNINAQLEHLQAKYVGTGHADIKRISSGT